MAISSDYTAPVQVNGFGCNNCTDVDYAKKHIDPRHPQSGPYDINAATDFSRTHASVIFGGNLAGLDATAASHAPVNAIGSLLDVRA